MKIVADHPLTESIEAVRGKYADVPTSVDEFLARKWERGQ